MSERYQRASGVGPSYIHTTKMDNEFTPKKTMIILVIVVACFAVLWPKIFYPMLLGSANQQIKPSAIDRTTGCCYVLSDTDMDTIKIMSELCGDIIRRQVGDGVPLTGRQIINICQDEVYKTCGIDVSIVLQEQVRLGHTTKQILDEIRSLNGSLCLKYNFGVQPWKLGVPHLITLKNVSDYVRQERSPLVRSEMVHPAFRERGRAIPQSNPSRPHPKIIDGIPNPLPGMRPTMGGPGHMMPPPKQQGSGSMGYIMPIYTIGIIIFFTYTLMKMICKKHPDTDTIYSKMELDSRLRRDTLNENGSRDAGSCKLVVNAMSALLDEVDQEMEARRRSSEVAQDEILSNSNLSNGSVKKEEKPSVKIMAMETTESCEDGKKWQSANSSVLPKKTQAVNEQVDPPKEIFLERTLPAQSQILVADSATETEKSSSDDDSAVVLAGKMTLSVISLENEELEIGDILKVKRDEEVNAINEHKEEIEEEIDNIIEEAIKNLDNDKLDDDENEILSKEVQSFQPSEEDIHDTNNTQKNVPNEEPMVKNAENKDLEKQQELAEILNDSNVPNEEKNNTINDIKDIEKEVTKNASTTKKDESSLETTSTEVLEETQPGLADDNLESPKPSSSPMLNMNTKSSSEDSGSTVLSGSNQGSVINVGLRDATNENEEELEDEEVSEEESEVEYEEEEIEISEEDEEVEKEILNVLSETGHQNAGMVNGIVTQNGAEEDEDSDEEEIIEEIIEEYTDDEENVEFNSN